MKILDIVNDMKTIVPIIILVALAAIGVLIYSPQESDTPQTEEVMVESEKVESESIRDESTDAVIMEAEVIGKDNIVIMEADEVSKVRPSDLQISYLENLEKIDESYFLTIDTELQEEISCMGASDGVSPDPGVICVDLLHVEHKKPELKKGSSVEVSDNAQVVVYIYADGLQQITIPIDEFFEIQDKSKEHFYYSLRGIQNNPFQFKIEDNKVIWLEQIYTP